MRGVLLEQRRELLLRWFIVQAGESPPPKGLNGSWPQGPFSHAARLELRPCARRHPPAGEVNRELDKCTLLSRLRST